MSRELGKGIGARIIGMLFAALLICVCVSAKPRRKMLPTHPINLNRATLSQLEELPDVGPSTARAILKFRRVSGPFERVSDLLAIRGISRGRFDKIRPYVFVGKKKARPASSSGTAKRN